METNKFLQELYEEQILANKNNLQKVQDALLESNKAKQNEY